MKVLSAVLVVSLACAPAALAAEGSHWTGSWKLDAARSSVGAEEGAAPGYVFAVTPDGHITWQIPVLGEVVTGRTDGQPMDINRTKPEPGLTLSVRAEGPLLLHYEVAKNGKPEGAGIMRLIKGGKAWVGISWRADDPEHAGELVHVRH